MIYYRGSINLTCNESCIEILSNYSTFILLFLLITFSINFVVTLAEKGLSAPIITGSVSWLKYVYN